MKRVRYGLAAAMAVGFTLGLAPAASSQVEFSGNVTIISDYIFRGITQTSGKPAIQGGIDAALPYGLYFGTWGSSIHFGDEDPAAVELDVYGGIAPSVGGFDLDLGVIYYGYPGATDLDYPFLEVYGGASRALGPVTANVNGAYSPAFFGDSGTAFFGQVGASSLIPSTPVGIDVTVGKQWLEEIGSVDPSYLVWTAGATVDILGVSLLAGISGTDIDGDDPRFAFGISRAF